MLTSTDALCCPRCKASWSAKGADSACIACGLSVVVTDYVDFLVDDSALDSMTAEIDYAWDYNRDPLISPVTLARWAVSADLLREVIVGLSGASVRHMVSVGGGGENWTGQRLNGLIDEYVVVDPSRVQLERQVYPKGADCCAARAVAEMLPIRDGWADVVEFQGVIDHVADVDRALVEARRAIAPGGYLTVQVTNEHSWYKRLAAMLRVQRGHAHAHQHEFSVQSLSQVIEAAGFVVVSTTTVAFLRLPLVVERVVGRVLSQHTLERFVRATDQLLSRMIGSPNGGIMTVVARRA